MCQISINRRPSGLEPPAVRRGRAGAFEAPGGHFGAPTRVHVLQVPKERGPIAPRSMGTDSHGICPATVLRCRM